MRLSDLAFAVPALIASTVVAGCSSSSGNPGSVLASGLFASGGGLLSPQEFAVSASGLFFINSNTGNSDTTTLQKVPTAGGSATTLVSSSEAPTAFALDATNVYVLDTTGIVKLPQTGGSPTTLVTTANLASPPSNTSFIASSGVLFWIALDASSGISGSLWTLDSTATGSSAAPKAVAQNLPGPCAVAVGGASVYWLDCKAGTLSSLPLASLATASPEVLGSGLGLTGGENASAPLAAAGGSVFWGETKSGAIRKLTLGSKSPVTLATNSGQIPVALVTDGTEVYWLSETAGDSPSEIWKVAASGGSATEVLGPGQDSSAGYAAIAIDESYLYFEDNDDGTLRRESR